MVNTQPNIYTQQSYAQPSQQSNQQPNFQAGFPQQPYQQSIFNLIDNPFDREVYEVLRSKGWIDKDQLTNDSLMCVIDGDLYFQYILKNNQDETPDEFTLLLKIGDFKDKKLDKILRLCQDWNSYLSTCKVYVSSPLLNSNDDENLICVMYCIPKSYISDINLTLERAIEEIYSLAKEITEAIY